MQNKKILNSIKNLQSPQQQYTKHLSFQLLGEAKSNQIVKLTNVEDQLFVQPIHGPQWKISKDFPPDLICSVIRFDQYSNLYLAGHFKNDILAQGRTIQVTEKNCSDIFVAKYHDNNNIFFITIPGLGNDIPHDLIIDQDSLYLTGNFTHSITFDSAYLQSKKEEGTNVFIAKMNILTQEWIWAKNAGGMGNDVGLSLGLDDDYLYLTGIYQNEIQFFDAIPEIKLNNRGHDLFLAKINYHNGDWIWTKNTSGFLIDEILFQDIRISISQHNKYLIGKYRGKTYLGDCELIATDHVNGFITKFDDHGNWLWVIDLKELPIMIKQDSREFVYLLSHYNEDSILTRYNNNGILVWKKKLSGKLNDLVLDHEFHILLTGKIGKKIIIYKFKNTGDLVYQDSFANLDTEGIQLEKNGEDLFILTQNSEKTKTQVLIHQEDNRYLPALGIIKKPFQAKHGETVDVDFMGIVSQFQTDLIPSYNYYIQEDGTLEPISNNFYFGTAISTDKMLIKLH